MIEFDRAWRRTKYKAHLLYKGVSRISLAIVKPLLLLLQRQPAAFRNPGLFLLFLVACFVPSVLRFASVPLSAFVQIFWSLGIFAVGLSIAWVHFLVEKEQDALAHGLLGRERKRSSEVPLARYSALDGLVALPTLGVACLGMVLAFAFLMQGFFDLGLQGWFVVKGQAPTIGTWLLFTMLSVVNALDIFDVFSQSKMSGATIQHQGVVVSTLVFVFKAIFDILLIAKIRDWWSKRNLAAEAISALAHSETRQKAEETLRRCRKSAIAPLVDTYHRTRKTAVKTSILRLLQELSYNKREAFLLEALQSKEEEVRREATVQLGKQKTQTAIQGLQRALGDRAAEVRTAAALGLQTPAFGAEVAPMLHKALRDTAGTVREAAARSLAALALAESRQPLLDALQDREGSVRGEVVKALGRFPADVFLHLAPLLQDPNKGVRIEVVKVVAELVEREPAQAVNFLLEALADAEKEVRLEAITHLHWSQTTKAIPALGSLVVRDRSFEVRTAAAAALGYMETKQAIAPLLPGLQDPHYQVRCRAIESLGDLRARDAIDALLALVRDGDRDVRKQVVTTLGEMRVQEPKVFDVLTLALDDVDEEVRVATLCALAELTDGKATVMARAFQDTSAKVREEVINALSSPIEAEFLPLVLARLQDPAEVREVRKAAINAFSFYELDAWPAIEAQVLPHLQSLLSKDSNDDLVLRLETISAIGMVGFGAAAACLLPLLQSDESEIRRETAQALFFIDGPEVVHGLIGALGDENFRVRATAAEALGEYAERHALPEAVAPLVAALQDEEEEVRKHAALALGQVRVPAALDALLGALEDPDSQVRTAGAEALGVRNGGADANEPEAQRVIQALCDAMQDQSSDVREAAALGLGSIEAPQAIEALTQAVRKDASGGVRFTAVLALGEFKAKAAIETLTVALQRDDDEWVRASAAEILGDLQVTKALPFLQHAMRQDPSIMVREKAVGAVASFDDPKAHAAIAQALALEEHSDVREVLIEAFGDLALSAHKDVLEQAIAREEEPKLRRLANKILQEL